MTENRTHLLACEMGSKLSHLGRDLALARHYDRLGNRVVLAVSDLRAAGGFLGNEGFTLLQAPLLRTVSRSKGPSINFADMLLNRGFADAVALTAAVDAWLALIEMVCPAILVYNNSPTALIAARIAKIPVKLIGSALEIPPKSAALPCFLPVASVTMAALWDAETSLVEHINRQFMRHGTSSISRLSDLYSQAEIHLTTVKELDPFGPRPDTAYIGPVFELPRPHIVNWSPADEAMPFERRRVFAYLHPSLPNCESVLEALQQSYAEVICVLSSCPPEWARRFDRIAFHTQALALALILPKTELVVTCGVGMMTTALLAAVPVIFVPETTEQLLITLAAQRTEAVEIIHEDFDPKKILRLLRNILTQDQWRANALKFAERYLSIEFENNASELEASQEAHASHSPRAS